MTKTAQAPYVSPLAQEINRLRVLLARAHDRTSYHRRRAERWKAKALERREAWTARLAELEQENRRLKRANLTVTALRAEIVYLERQLELLKNTTAPARTSLGDARERGQEVAA